MPPGEASLGLTEVLCGRGDDELKGAAVDALVALGGLAEPDLVAILDDPDGGDWARAALEQIRFEREHPGAGDVGDEDEDPDVGDDDSTPSGEESAEDADDEVAGDDGPEDEPERRRPEDEDAEDARPSAGG